MAMFRRRTDRVYATLQQVQRRITQGDPLGAPPSAAAPNDGPGAPARVATVVGGSFRADTQGGYRIRPDGRREMPPQLGDVPDDDSDHRGSASSASLHDPVPMVTSRPQPRAPSTERSVNPALRLAAGEGPRLHLSLSVALTIAVIWTCSLVLFFILGRWSAPVPSVADADLTTLEARAVGGGPRASASAGGTATGPGPSGSLRPPGALGDYILILESVARASRESEENFRDKSEQANAWARENGFGPYFGVRTTSAGGLQWVYGKVGAVYGIPHADEDARIRRLDSRMNEAASGRRWFRLYGG